MNQDAPIPLFIENLQLTYRCGWGRKARVVVQDFNLQLNPGEIFALLGPNGSGKTSTFKSILGFVKPKKGIVKIEGFPAGSQEARQHLGYLPENPYFPLYLTGREVLESYGRLSGLCGKKLVDRVEEMIHLVQMNSFSEQRLATYSKGMIQRVSLGQALLHDPKLLLLDEPTTGLDPMGVQVMRELMLKLREMGKSILFTSHLLEQVETLADRIAILYQGKKLVEGKIQDLLQSDSSTTIQVQGIGMDKKENIHRLLQEIGGREIKVRPGAENLEAIFWKAIS